MFHAPTGCSTYRTTYRRVFHGDAPSRGQHRPGDFIDRNSPNNPSLSSNRGPNPSSPSSPSSPRDLSSLSSPSSPSSRSNPNNPSAPSRCNNPNSLSNRSDYSSEASSFIPSSIRDLSRNEKLSLIVLRWLPSG